MFYLFNQVYNVIFFLYGSLKKKNQTEADDKITRLLTKAFESQPY